MNFNEFYTESILDTPRTDLDPTVFELVDGLPPKLHGAIKAQILEDVLRLKRKMVVNKTFIIGSILTKTYNKNSDIDVTLEVNSEDVHPETGLAGVEELTYLLRDLNGNLAVGTTHPINYYITTEFREENADAIYDIDTDAWVKEPYDTQLEIANYMQKFEELVSSIDLSTGKLKRDVVDYMELKDLDESSIINFHTILNKKLYEINKNIEELVKFKKDIKSKRQDAFSQPLTPDQILKYASKNRLPANVIYKLFQKYYYFDLINRLDDIISNRDKSNEYVDDIEDVLGYKESVSFEEFDALYEDFKTFKGGKVDWAQPKSVRKYRDRRFNLSKGLAGKSLRQTPNIYSRNSNPSSFRTLGLANKVVDVAKRSPSGIWRLTPLQVKEIALKYHHIPPNKHDPIKHLGNTGIVVWRKTPKHFYLVKHRHLRKS